MRRCLHSLLIGVFTVLFTVDAARACGHLRRAWCCPPCATPAIVVPAPSAWDECGELPVVGDCRVAVDDGFCGGGLVILGGFEEIGCGAPLACCGGEISVPSPSVAGSPAVLPGESVVARPSPSPEVVQPTPAEPADPVVSKVPELQPVEPVKPASGAEETVELVPEPAEEKPAGEAATVAEEMEKQPVEPEARPEAPVTEEAAPTEPPVSPSAPEPQPEPPPQRNIFEQADEAERAGDPDPVEDGSSAAPPASGTEEAAADAVPADVTPVPELETPPLEDSGAESPAGDSAPSADPVAEPESSSSAEPMRRWLDDTARYAVVGRLVDVRGDAVELLRVDGRQVTVPLARLSRFDRDYVTDAAPRVLAARHGGPRPGDTASR